MRYKSFVVALVMFAGMLTFSQTASAYYHTGMGRFMSRDPIADPGFATARVPMAQGGGFVPRDEAPYSDGMNLYEYVGSDPVNWGDWNGLSRNGFADRQREEMEEARRRRLAQYVDPSAQILLCNRTAQVIGGNVGASCGLYHRWINIPQPDGGVVSGGMGNGEGVPGAGGQTSPDLPYSSTYVQDHSGEPTAGCKPVSGVDVDCVQAYLQPGTYTGRWTPCNNCNTWANEVISKCKPRCIPDFEIRKGWSRPRYKGMKCDYVQYPDGSFRKPTRITP